MLRVSKTPITVRLLLTNRCNLNCSFCINSSGRELRKELKTSEWLKVFEDLKALKVFRVIVSGGEAFMREDIFELLGALKNNRSHQISILTNGSLIDENRASKLVKLGLKNLAISIDGMESSHDEIRGSGTFKKTLSGLKELVKAGIVPQVSFTPIKSNYKDLEELLDLCYEAGVKIFFINTLNPEGRCDEVYDKLVLNYPSEVEEVVSVYMKKKDQCKGMKIECGMGFYYNLPTSYKRFMEINKDTNQKKYLKEGCGAASTSCTITAEGNIVPCEGFVDFVGGNIRNKDLKEVWESELFVKIRNLGKLSTSDIPICEDCDYNVLCNGGCRAMAYKMLGSLTAPDFICPYRKGGISI